MLLTNFLDYKKVFITEDLKLKLGSDGSNVSAVKLPLKEGVLAEFLAIAKKLNLPDKFEDHF